MARAWLPGGFVVDEVALLAAERATRWQAIGAIRVPEALESGTDEWVQHSSLVKIFLSDCCLNTAIAAWSAKCEGPTWQTCVDARVMAW